MNSPPITRRGWTSPNRYFHARLTLLNGGAYHIPEPPASLPPLPDESSWDSSLLWLARGEDRPPPVPVAAAAELDDVDGACPTCGNRNTPAPPSFTARMRKVIKGEDC